MTETRLSHVDAHGQANMVDVSSKPPSTREAKAEGFVVMKPETLAMISSHRLAKGDVFSVARIAGIQAAKKCADLIPLCHPLLLSHIDIEFNLEPDNDRVRIRCQCKLTGNTGVEMEALTGVSVAAITLFDMCKAIDPGMQLEGIRVLSKTGGKSGNWTNGSQTC